MRATAVGWFFGIGRIGSFLAPAVVGFMLQFGAGAYVLHTFALTFLLAAIALWFVGVETKGKTLEEITGAAQRRGLKPHRKPALPLPRDCGTAVAFALRRRRTCRIPSIEAAARVHRHATP